MNKTLRNKALRNSTRLFTATLNGENWASPDGHFAIAYPIYDGYRVKKDQYIPDGKPDLQPLLHANSMYTLAGLVEQIDERYRITNGEHYWDINADYYNLIMNIYPDAKMYVDKTGYNFTPIEVKENNTLVAVLMPLKR